MFGRAARRGFATAAVGLFAVLVLRFGFASLVPLRAATIPLAAGLIDATYFMPFNFLYIRWAAARTAPTLTHNNV